jgi:hypothetical protein
MKSSGIENIVAGFREWVERMARKDIRADYHLDWNHSEKCGSPGPQCSMWITPPQPMHLLKTSFFFLSPGLLTLNNAIYSSIPFFLYEGVWFLSLFFETAVSFYWEMLCCLMARQCFYFMRIVFFYTFSFLFI